MNEIILRRASSIIFSYLNSIEDDYTVLIPANICPIVFLTIIKAKKKVKIININNFFEMNLEYAEDYIHKVKGRAVIIFVRPYGYINENKDLDNLKENFQDLKIIDDRCLCRPDLTYSSIFNFADLTLFSTGYSKYVELSYGGGLGLIKGNNLKPIQDIKFEQDNLEIQMNRIKNSLRDKRKFEYIDSNWLDCNVMDISIDTYKNDIKEKINTIDRHKEKINKIYFDNLNSICEIDEKYNNWRFNIIVENAVELEKFIFKNGFYASRHYSDISCLLDKEKCKITSKYNYKMINLFNDFHITEEQAHDLSLHIRRFLR
ncbi:hypothetical protein [Photobacterium leiognathi]|uniref:hypothetical protein n=1 Tax=Photobacterium leiognathi TaxID=553611 RepID=UPI002982162A|nr:hypothetical protein [Photobacterium leiognathi]